LADNLAFFFGAFFDLGLHLQKTRLNIEWHFTHLVHFYIYSGLETSQAFLHKKKCSYNLSSGEVPNKKHLNTEKHFFQ